MATRNRSRSRGRPVAQGSVIESARIKSCWLTHGVLAAPASLLSALVTTVTDGEPNAMTHWFVVIKSSDGWFTADMGNLYGPFDSERRADIQGCSTLKMGGADPKDKDVTCKRSAVRIQKDMVEVRRYISEYSVKYSCTEWARNCKGFADQLLNFLQGESCARDANPLHMNVRSGQSEGFDHAVIARVRVVHGGIWYKERVYVTVKKPCRLKIRDGEPDTYNLLCIRTGEHYVDYNSRDPTIKWVQYELL